MRYLKICGWIVLCGWFGINGGIAQLVDTIPANKSMHEAEAFWFAGKQESSLEAYHTAVDIYRKAETWQAYFEAVGQLCQAYYYAGEIEGGVQFAQTLDTSLFLDNGISRYVLSNFCLNVGALYEIGNQAESADHFYKKSLQGYRQIPAGVDSLDMWEKLANANQFIGISLGKRQDWLRALHHGKENLRIRSAYLPPNERLADAYTDLGFHYDHLGRYDSAVLAYKGAEAMFLSLPDTLWKSLGLVCHNISYVFGMIGDHRQELTYGEKALDYWLKGTDLLPDYLLNCYSHLAEIYLDLGDCEKSQDYYYKALESARDNFPNHSPQLGTTYLKMGQSCLKKTDPLLAMDFLDNSEELLSQLPQPNLSYLGIVHTTKGRLYKNMEEYDLALKEHQKAIELHSQSKDSIRIFEDFVNLAGVYLAMEQWATSLFYMEQARKPAEAAKSKHLALIYAGTGYLKAKLGDEDGAMIWIQRSLARMTRDSTLDQSDWSLNPRLNQIFHHQRNLDILENKAKALLVLAQQREENVYLLTHCWTVYQLCLEVIQSMQIRSQSTREILTEESLNIYEGALQCVHMLYEKEKDPEYLEVILKLIEQSKSASLRKNLQQSRAVLQAGLPDELLEKERKLSAQIAFYQQKILNKKIDEQIQDTIDLSYWNEKLFTLNEEKRKLHIHLAEAYPDYYQIRYQTHAVSVKAVRQDMLEEGESMINFFLGDSTLMILLISAEETRIYRKTVSSDWKDQLTSFLNNLVHYHQQINPVNNLPAFAKGAHHWYQQLIAPVVGVDSNPPSALLILPDDILALMPFELLLTGDSWSTGSMYSKLPYLLKSSQVRYAYSLSWLATISDHSIRLRKPTFFGMAPTYKGSNEVEYANLRSVPLNQRGPFRSLVHNRTEIESISEVWKGGSMIGESATEAAFKEVCANYDILHLAMHAYLEYDDPMFSALVFSESATTSSEEDRFLHAYEIYNLSLGIDLLVLSACETGIGKIEKGEGVQSLAQAFAYAGVQSMVTSLWQIDDASTGWIMERMYAYLQEGENRPQALRLARLDYMNKFPGAHPGYWGAYVFWGNPDPLIPQYSIGVGILIALMIILGIGTSLWWVKRRNLRQIF